MRRWLIWRSVIRFIRTRFMPGRSSCWSRLRGPLKAAAAMPGRPRAQDREAARQDRPVDRGAGFFSEEVRKMSTPDRRALVDRGHGELSVRRQCQLLGVARSGVYRPRPAANDDDAPALMRRIDELFTAWPFLGSRRMTVMLRAERLR